MTSRPLRRARRYHPCARAGERRNAVSSSPRESRWGLSHLFAGVRISVSYAVVGAVISEWLGGFQGLGVYMTRVKKSYAYDKMFAVIFLITALSLLLMKAVDLIQKIAMPWNRKETKGLLRN